MFMYHTNLVGPSPTSPIFPHLPFSKCKTNKPTNKFTSSPSTEEVWRKKEEEQKSKPPTPVQKATDFTEEVGNNLNKKTVRAKQKKIKKSAEEVLRKNVFTLTPESQKKFDQNLRNQLTKISGFQTTFSQDNVDYSKEKNPENLEVSKKYTDLFTRGKSDYTKVTSYCSSLKSIFNERIGLLTAAIETNSLEQNFLKEMTVGAATLGFERYGIPYRLSELVSELQTRNKKIEATPKKDSETSIMRKNSEKTSVTNKLASLCDLIVILKEKVTIFNSVAVKCKNEDMKNYYFFYKQELEKLEKKYNSLLNEYEKKISGLKQLLSIEKDKLKPEGLLDHVFQEELDELTTCRTSFITRYAEVSKALSNSPFSKEKLSIGDVEPKLFSQLFEETQNFLSSIVSLKERVKLENQWEFSSPLTKRRLMYQGSLLESEKLTREKEGVEKSVRDRVKLLQTATETYESYIIVI